MNVRLAKGKLLRKIEKQNSGDVKQNFQISYFTRFRYRTFSSKMAINLQTQKLLFSSPLP